MDTLLHRFGSLVKGVITGFDRIVFKGQIRPILFALGMQNFLGAHGVLNKDYKDWVTNQSKKIIEHADKYSQDVFGHKAVYISSLHVRKEELAHEQKKKLGIDSGLVGIWSCVESCDSFKSAFDVTTPHPKLIAYKSRCKHLYFYYDHSEYGFMSIRLQTWAPYDIQIALNGREWLRRQLDKKGCSYIISENKFLHIDDYELAQQLLDSQEDVKWEEMLGEFVPLVFPSMSQLLEEGLDYYWTLWQSERAKDYIFDSPQSLYPHINDLLRHAFLTGTSDRVLRYMGRPVNAAGQPHSRSNLELLSRVNLWYEGMRIRHWVDKNSLKLYNEQNVLRVEMTMNNPGKFLVYRHAEGQDKSEAKKLMPMRKGVADIKVRAQVSDDRINSFTEHLATFENKTPVRELMSSVLQPFTLKGKRIRSLDITGKDREFLLSISDPIFDVSHITNKQLQAKLCFLPWAKGMTQKQLSSKISRHLRLLRDHGLIKKVPNQHKYSLTKKGREITTALNVMLSASTNDLLKISA
jgi:hypothetical protein